MIGSKISLNSLLKEQENISIAAMDWVEYLILEMEEDQWDIKNLLSKEKMSLEHLSPIKS